MKRLAVSLLATVALFAACGSDEGTITSGERPTADDLTVIQKEHGGLWYVCFYAYASDGGGGGGPAMSCVRVDI